MGGGWFGYIYAILGCGALVGVVVLSTLALYFVARVRERRQPSARVSVSAVRADGDRPDLG